MNTRQLIEKLEKVTGKKVTLKESITKEFVIVEWDFDYDGEGSSSNGANGQYEEVPLKIAIEDANQDNRYVIIYQVKCYYEHDYYPAGHSAGTQLNLDWDRKIVKVMEVGDSEWEGPEVDKTQFLDFNKFASDQEFKSIEDGMHRALEYWYEHRD